MEVVRKKGLVIGMLPSLINLQQEDLVDAQGDGHGGRVEDAEDQQVQHGRHDWAQTYAFLNKGFENMHADKKTWKALTVMWRCFYVPKIVTGKCEIYIYIDT